MPAPLCSPHTPAGPFSRPAVSPYTPIHFALVPTTPVPPAVLAPQKPKPPDVLSLMPTAPHQPLPFPNTPLAPPSACIPFVSPLPSPPMDSPPVAEPVIATLLC